MMNGLLYGIAYAQNLIPCPDGTMADPKIGCVETPGNIVNPQSGLIDLILKTGKFVGGGAAVIATLFLIYGGILYATAAGDSEKIDKAKRTLFWAVFGLIVSLLALYLAQFVIGVTGN